MSRYISRRLRALVRQRANNCCEYCRLPEEYGFGPYQPDHIVALKHRGETQDENLAWACFDCNHLKGTDVASIDIETGQVVRLFNPRLDDWEEHFRLEGPRIAPLTAVGRVTEHVLQFNRPEMLEIRSALIQAGEYPG